MLQQSAKLTGRNSTAKMVNTALANAVFTIFVLDLIVLCTFFASNLHKVNLV